MDGDALRRFRRDLKDRGGCSVPPGDARVEEHGVRDAPPTGRKARPAEFASVLLSHSSVAYHALRPVRDCASAQRFYAPPLFLASLPLGAKSSRLSSLLQFLSLQFRQ